jgi:uncharacterized protein YqeY
VLAPVHGATNLVMRRAGWRRQQQPVAANARKLFGTRPRTSGKIRNVNELKERIRADLTDAMRARDQVRLRALRMALTSITNEEVSGHAVKELSDDEVVKVLTREAKKRREAAEAFETAGRTAKAADERAEGEVLAEYLPAQLTDEELGKLVATAISETGAVGMPAMGKVMKTLTPQVAGRADGARVAAEVRRQLAG